MTNKINTVIKFEKSNCNKNNLLKFSLIEYVISTIPPFSNTRHLKKVIYNQ